MELMFVIKSIRRYWWVFAACVLAGVVVPGVVLIENAAPEFVSQAVLLVSPPSESRVSVNFNSDPDRYVLGQLSVLRSQSLAEQVASRTPGQTTESVMDAREIEHELETDIVNVVITTNDPETSKEIGDAYVEVYFDILEGQVSETRQGEIDELDRELAQYRTDIEAIDNNITLVMKQFLPTELVRSQGAFAPIPSVDQVAPGLVSQRQILLADYEQTLASRTALFELEINARLRITSEIVQNATLPEEFLPKSNRLTRVAGLVAGILLGLVAAAAAGRLSRTAVDEQHVADALGVPIVGEIPRSRALAKNRRAAAELLPHRLVGPIDAIAVQAEANAEVGHAFTVVVVGAERASGCTTLAAALANRYAVAGSQVLLVDVDARDSELTRLFAGSDGGIPALLAMNDAGRSRTQRGVAALSPTALAGLSVVGIGDKSASGSLRRQTLPELVSIASSNAHVVVFDGGPLLDSATTVQLTQMVDAVVLAVPMRRVLTKTLTRLATQLQTRRGELIPVLMPATRSRFSRGVQPPSGAVGLVDPPVIAAVANDDQSARSIP